MRGYQRADGRTFPCGPRVFRRAMFTVFGSRIRGCSPRLGKSGDISKAQHCRAEAFLDDAGWFPLDPADVRKVVLEQKMTLDSPEVRALRERLFGNWEMNWIGYNSANDIELPGSGWERSNFSFLMYPCAITAAGQPNALDPARFRYEIHGARTGRVIPAALSLDLSVMPGLGPWALTKAGEGRFSFVSSNKVVGDRAEPGHDTIAIDRLFFTVSQYAAGPGHPSPRGAVGGPDTPGHDEFWRPSPDLFRGPSTTSAPAGRRMAKTPRRRRP